MTDNLIIEERVVERDQVSKGGQSGHLNIPLLIHLENRKYFSQGVNSENLNEFNSSRQL